MSSFSLSHYYTQQKLQHLSLPRYILLLYFSKSFPQHYPLQRSQQANRYNPKSKWAGQPFHQVRATFITLGLQSRNVPWSAEMSRFQERQPGPMTQKEPDTRLLSALGGTFLCANLVIYAGRGLGGVYWSTNTFPLCCFIYT